MLLFGNISAREKTPVSIIILWNLIDTSSFIKTTSYHQKEKFVDLIQS